MNERLSLLGLAIFTALGVAVLTSLGFWQLERLKWKTALLDRIHTNTAAAPIEIPLNVDAARLSGLEEYRHVCAEGVFENQKELYLFSTDRLGRPGYQVITPLVRNAGSTVLVNRGFVPLSNKDPATRFEGLLENRVRVCGTFLLDEPKRFFTPNAEPEKNIWYIRDGAAMAKTLTLKTSHPIFLEADGAPNPGGLPIGGQTRLDIPNNHLSYAITWFGLSLTLVGGFLFFARQQLRRLSK